MKFQKLAFCTASVLMLSVFSAVAGAASKDVDGNGAVNGKDASALLSALVQKSELTAACDVNADSAVNAFDLASLKQTLLQDAMNSGESVTADYAATAQYTKLIGRTWRDADITWLVQSGSAAEFVVTGTSATLTIAGDGCVYSDEKYRPRYAVLVDGEVLIDEVMSVEEKEIELFSGTTARSATVRVIHLSEANNGAVGVKNLSVTSVAKNPVVPTEKKDLQIEFIGDSITCAYGVEGESQYEAFSTATENFMKSYAYLTAEKLGADYSAVAYSGHGVVSGYTTGDINTDSLVPDVYEYVGKIGNYQQPWDFEANPNDVVVINLGTNDSSYLTNDFENRSPEFVAAYTDFLQLVREKNPDAYIICTVGTMGCEDVYPLIEQAIVDYQAINPDTRITSYLSATQSMNDGLGSDWHPSLKTQQNSAYVLADKICEVLGLESDKVGLDAVADATYDVDINTENGANAAFFVGYDKSFWINLSMGGTSASDVEAYLCNFALYAGEYQLEFDYTSTVDVTVPFAVQHKDTPDTSYFSDTISATSESQHYTGTFTIAAADENSELLFSLGGMDYFNITLSNIKLIKLS